MPRKAQPPNRVRSPGEDRYPEGLLESALVEFGPRASTVRRRVRSRGGSTAHQPQINYHFESKAHCGPPRWTTLRAIGEGWRGDTTKLTGVDVLAVAAAFADGIRRSWDSHRAP